MAADPTARDIEEAGGERKLVSQYTQMGFFRRDHAYRLAPTRNLYSQNPQIREAGVGIRCSTNTTVVIVLLLGSCRDRSGPRVDVGWRISSDGNAGDGIRRRE